MTQIKAVVEPDRIENDIWGESVTFLRIHPQILSVSARYLFSNHFSAPEEQIARLSCRAAGPGERCFPQDQIISPILEKARD